MFTKLIMRKFKLVIRLFAWSLLVVVPAITFVVSGFILKAVYGEFNFINACLAGIIAVFFVYIIESVAVPVIDFLLKSKDEEKQLNNFPMSVSN